LTKNQLKEINALFINQILDGLCGLSKPQHKFLAVLFNTLFVCQSRINFSSLARHSGLSERSFRRNFRKEVEFVQINQAIIEKAKCQITAFAMDAAFIKKSGKQTFGLDKFWNGCASRAEKGLEASIISLVDLEQNASFALTVDQTEPNLETNEVKGVGKTRIDFYAQQLQRVAPEILKYTRTGLFDGYYAKKKFVDKVIELGFVMISKLRCDANLKYLYEGEQSGERGRPKKYDGKVEFDELSRFDRRTIEIQKQKIGLYEQIVWSVSLKRKVKLVVVKHKKRSVNLFSTDLEMKASEVFRLYRSRFTIEFLIRDAKQSAGLSDCQARDNKAIEFHWNTALTTVNFGRGIVSKELIEDKNKPFSMKSIKQRHYNENLLKLFISKLDLEQSLIKYQEPFEQLSNYAVISP
jgi:hypothetical protein